MEISEQDHRLQCRKRFAEDCRYYDYIFGNWEAVLQYVSWLEDEVMRYCKLSGGITEEDWLKRFDPVKPDAPQEKVV